MENSLKIRGGVQPSVKIRNSNLELFRIITMFSIVAHHYVVNSGLTATDGVILSNPTSVHSLVLLLVGAWGKIGINSFVLITGYFMCKSNITLNKFVKLVFEWLFYKYTIGLIFLITGYSEFSLKEFVKLIIPIKSIGDGFTSAYVVFFLFIPFLNVLVRNISERQHIRLLLLVGFTYVFFATVPFFSVTFNYVSWFMVLYLISSYIRLYPKNIYENNTFWGIALLISTVICAISVISCAFVFKSSFFMFVTDSNTLLAVVEAICAFMFFKNLKMKNCKFINLIASATFGVLCIHAASDDMRSWLWGDLLNVVGVHSDGNGYLHIVLSVLGVYSVCTVIDIIRIYLIEKPFFKFWNKKTINLNKKYNLFEDKICEKLHIQ